MFTEKVALLAGFPPEHNAHVINALFYSRGLIQMGVQDLMGLSANPRRPPFQSFNADLSRYQVPDMRPLKYPDVPIYNLRAEADDYHLDQKSTTELIQKIGAKVLFMSYYPLFGAQLIDTCKELGVKTILLVKIALVQDPALSPLSDYHKGYEESLRKADVLIVLQEGNKRTLVDQCKIHPDKIHVVHKFVDDELLATVDEERSTVLNEMKLTPFFDGETPVLGYVGRMDEEKNILPFVRDIWPLVRNQLKGGVKLLLAGTGRQVEEVLQSVQSDPFVCLRQGSLSNLALLSLLKSLDVLAFPSGRDYTPRIPMEALRVGTPVVLNDLNFNRVFIPPARAVSVEGFQQYQPYGYNNPLQGKHVIERTYGVPSINEFAYAIADALTVRGSVTLDEDIFTTKGFVSQMEKVFASL